MMYARAESSDVTNRSSTIVDGPGMQVFRCCVLLPARDNVDFHSLKMATILSDAEGTVERGVLGVFN